MGLFGRKKSAASLTLSPDGPYRPTDTITVSVDLDEALDGVTAARVELGYVNGFRYRWAGRADSALKYDNSSFLLSGQVGTDYGSDKDTEEWVHVLDVPLTVAGGVLGSGNHQVAVRLPSWSPGSSKEIVQWQLRLHVERSGKNVTAEVPFTVLSTAPDPLPAPADMPFIAHERALADDVEIEILTERSAYRPGEEVRGNVAVTMTKHTDRKALLAAWFQRVQESHPVEKNPGEAVESFTRPMVNITKDLQLVQHQRVEFPFALTLPADADPTTEAVNSSISWFVQIKVEFSGATGAIERAQRGIVVHTG